MASGMPACQRGASSTARSVATTSPSHDSAATELRSKVATPSAMAKPMWVATETLREP
jgi:hypothetical protein